MQKMSQKKGKEVAMMGEMVGYLILNNTEHLLVKRMLSPPASLLWRDVSGMPWSINLWSTPSHLQNELNNRCWSTVSVSLLQMRNLSKSQKTSPSALRTIKNALRAGHSLTLSQMSKSIKWCSRTAVIVDKAGQESTCIFWSARCRSAAEKKG